jgi:transposase, IS5 family
MYRKESPHQTKFADFYLPFSGQLSPSNRWVILAGQIPWQQIERDYSSLFSTQEGCPALSARIAFGALIIKERLGTSDRETLEQIRENPYLQYFLGLGEYRDETPFHHSMMTHFRQRFTPEILNRINEMIAGKALEQTVGAPLPLAQEPATPVDSSCRDEDQTLPPQGQLIVDATCAPADIKYPTDLNLLNEAREKAEAMIDTMHAPFVGQQHKPRTYRQEARKAYLAVAKKKKPGARQIRKAIGQQLRYLKRDLQIIETMAADGLLALLSKREYRNLLVIHELYRQQDWMYQDHSHQIADRIVSISQPHVRPMVRGKARNATEFGAKLSVSLVAGMSFVERISWDNYNESGDLIAQIEQYRRRFGFYPESIHADQIYRTRDNRHYCQQRGIRFSGPPLGRPKVCTEANSAELKQEKQLRHQDELDRNAIEGKFGQGKRRFTLGLIMAKLAGTATTVITLSFIVMNLEKILSFLLYFWLQLYPICRLARRRIASEVWDRIWNPASVILISA